MAAYWIQNNRDFVNYFLKEEPPCLLYNTSIRNGTVLCGCNSCSEAAGAGGVLPVDHWLDRLQLHSVMVFGTSTNV